MISNDGLAMRARSPLSDGAEARARGRQTAPDGKHARMSVVRIIQVDLAQPLPTVQTSSGDRRGEPGPLWILVKLGPHPVGWVRCDDPKKFGKQIDPDQLLKLANDALSRQIQSAARERAHAPIALTRTPSFSVVICTHNGGGGATALERQLQSIAALRYPQPNYEVIVVVDHVRDAATRAACEKFPFVRYAHDPRPGVNYARNTGWQLARYELVAYLDAGTFVDPDWLVALAAGYADGQVDCVTGLVLPREIDTPTQAQFETYLAARRKLRRCCWRAGTWNATFPLDATRFGGGGGAAAGGANLSVSRNALEAIGGFDVALNGDGGVLDIFARVLREGGAIVHDPRAIVFRSYPRTDRAIRAELAGAARGFTSFCAKHARDYEFGNHAIALLARWFKRGLIAAVRGGHLGREMALAELFAGIVGAGGYRRAARKVRKDQAAFAKQGKAAVELPLRTTANVPQQAPSAPPTPQAPQRPPLRGRGRGNGSRKKAAA